MLGSATLHWNWASRKPGSGGPSSGNGLQNPGTPTTETDQGPALQILSKLWPVTAHNFRVTAPLLGLRPAVLGRLALSAKRLISFAFFASSGHAPPYGRKKGACRS